MRWFNNLKIGKKLGLGFGIIELLTVILGIFSLAHLSKVNANTVDIATHWLPSIKVLGDMRSITSDIRRHELNHVTRTDGREEADEMAIIARGEILLAAAKKQYDPMISSPEEKRLSDDFRTGW
ncbi:MAG TPA: MCP four helix bundle domain-containing protein, partial [Candidatus Sulfotelmatobacter sp.]